MIKDLPSMEGKQVEIKGWIDTIREHGKLIFLEIRDITGTVQTLTTAKDETNFAIAKSLSKESSVRLAGEVKPRPEGTQNKDSPAGTVEIKISELEIYTKCPPLPFDIDNDELNEDTRLKYRYLDLRKDSMRENVIFRSKLTKFVRDFYEEE